MNGGVRSAARTGALLPPAALVGALATLVVADVTARGLKPALLLTLVVALLATSYRRLLAWRTLLQIMIVVILFIPIRRYTLPASLPFQLEPYRLLIAVVAVLWFLSLLVDARVRAVRTLLDGPLAAVFVAAAVSIGFNLPRIQALHVTSEAVKQLTFLGSFLVLFALVVSLASTHVEVDALLKVLVGGGAIVALAANLELSTGLNVFNHLDSVLPFLQQTHDAVEVTRGGHLRVVASSQHPIALGALFVLLIPPALYLIRSTGHKRWYAAIVLLALGALATGSRTAVVMLLVVALVYLALRSRETLRFWPAMIPLLFLVHLAMPGTIGGFYKSFFPAGGLVAEQAGAPVGSSRVASLGFGLHEIGLRPLFGSGYGARVFHGETANSYIVDDQWLSTGMEVGLLGVLAWSWLFTRFLRPVIRAARRDRTERGWLFVAIAASVASYAVGMLTYDAFSFIQTTFVMFFLLGVGCSSLAIRGREQAASE